MKHKPPPSYVILLTIINQLRNGDYCKIQFTKTNCAIPCEAIFADTKERSITIGTIRVFVTRVSIPSTLVYV